MENLRNDDIQVIFVVGPTAVGKSAFAVDLALDFNGDAEIVSADSMQVYRGLNIGTAKPSIEERKGVPHHMIDVADPKEDYSVGLYSQSANRIINDILSQGKTAIVCGGSGLYIHSLMYELDFSGSERDESLRKELTKEAEEKGSDYLYQKLIEIDPTSADKVHPNNAKRVIRALERLYGEIENDGIRGFENTYTAPKRYKSKIIRLTMDRDELYKRVEKRAEDFFNNGLVSEVQGLIDRGVPENSTAMKGIGYKEVIAMLKGEYDEEEALRLIKQMTRRYAKRQETWFKRYHEAELLNPLNILHVKA